MTALVDAALLGVGRAGAPPADADDAGDQMATRADDLGPERQLLLRLGVRAVRARAGFVPAAGPTPPAPAGADVRPVCSPSLAALVAELCRGRNPVLAEALARMDARGLRLPAHRLPTLASLRDPTLLPAAANVAGERGRWLALHNPAWRWLHGVAPASLEERKKTWEEGTAEARLAAVRATRETDPAEARGWIVGVWKAEKASFREEMVGALATGLSAGDEPLLVQALADRASGVRAAAATLLVRIETSELARRARDRADAFVSYDRGALAVTPPAAFAREWAADGLLEKPPQGTGERVFWLRQILALVPPRHWQQRFGVNPEALVQAAAASEWPEPVLAGWMDAAVSFTARGWAAPLWRVLVAQHSAGPLAATLFPLMDPAAAHDAARAEVERVGGSPPPAWTGMLAAAPQPWSRSLADAYLAALIRAFSAPSPDGALLHAWRGSLAIAAAALPIEALDRVLAFQPPPLEDPMLGQMRDQPLEALRAVAAVRKQIDQETRP